MYTYRQLYTILAAAKAEEKGSVEVGVYLNNKPFNVRILPKITADGVFNTDGELWHFKGGRIQKMDGMTQYGPSISEETLPEL